MEQLQPRRPGKKLTPRELALFRLAETLRVADPAKIEEKLPPYLIGKWYKYFEYKDNRFDKLEYYLVQLSCLIGGIAGIKPEDLIYRRPDEKRNGGGEKKTITPEELEKYLRLSFGV